MKKELNWGMLSKYRNVIYGLACISIILFHYAVKVPYENTFKGMFTYVFRGVIGSIGVEIFILMSGICMYFSFRKNDNIKEFYSKRFRRLVIPYVLIVVPFYMYKDIFIKGLDIKRVLYDLSYASFFTEGNISVWYILCIALMYFMYPVLFRVFEKYDKYRHAIFAILLGAAISVNLILYGFIPELYTRIEIMTMRLPIYIIGVYLGKKVYEKVAFTRSEITLFIIGVIIKLAIDFMRALEIITVPTFLVRYVNLNSSLVMLGLTVMLLVLCNVSSKNKLLVKCGLLSLELYLVHVTLMNVLSTYGYPITRYLYFAYYLIATVAISIFVNNITDLIENGIDRLAEYVRIYNTCEWKLKKIYKEHTGRTFRGVIRLKKYNNKLYTKAIEELYNKLLYDLIYNKNTLLEYKKDIKYIVDVVKNDESINGDYNDVVAVYIANMTDEYFIEIYKKYFCKSLY